MAPDPNRGTAGRPAGAQHAGGDIDLGKAGVGSASSADAAPAELMIPAARPGGELSVHAEKRGPLLKAVVRRPGGRRFSLDPAQAPPTARPSPSPVRGPAVLIAVLDFIERQLSRCTTVWQQALMFILLASFLIGFPVLMVAYVAVHVLAGASWYTVATLALAATGGGSVLFVKRLQSGSDARLTDSVAQPSRQDAGDDGLAEPAPGEGPGQGPDGEQQEGEDPGAITYGRPDQER